MYIPLIDIKYRCFCSQHCFIDGVHPSCYFAHLSTYDYYCYLTTEPGNAGNKSPFALFLS
jgi:hypothetical protein